MNIVRLIMRSLLTLQRKGKTMTDEEVNKINLIEKVNESLDNLEYKDIFDKLEIDLDSVISNELEQKTIAELIELL